MERKRFHNTQRDRNEGRDRMKNCVERLAKTIEEKKVDEFMKVFYECIKDKKTEVHGLVRTSELVSLGEKVRKEIATYDLKFLIDLWRISIKDEKTLVFGVKSGRTYRLFILGFLKNEAPHVKKVFVEKVADHIHDWETCDQLALKIISDLVLEDPDYLNELEKYLSEENPWKKRLPLASIPPLVKKKPQLSEKFLEFIEKAFEDGRTEVKKACGWALREISKIRPELVKKFVEKHREKNNKNVKWVLRDGSRFLKLGGEHGENQQRQGG